MPDRNDSLSKTLGHHPSLAIVNVLLMQNTMSALEPLIIHQHLNTKGSEWGPALGVAGGPTMLSGLVWQDLGS